MLSAEQVANLLATVARCESCNAVLQGNQTKFCSTRCKNIAHQSYDMQQKRGWERKRKLIEYFGGGCQRCGYKRNLAALDFHHRDATTKRFRLDVRNLSNRKASELAEEAVKCDLLCANCHREEHYPQAANTEHSE